ncbi:MAG: putative bifunctional diguanylate cyclase/phosphodiesterase [Pseudonocardiaceae bacterium]
MDSKVLALLGTLAGGYTAALRHRTGDQQQGTENSLLRARKEAKLARQVSEVRFREVFDSAPVGIAISGLDGTIEDTNEAFTKILEYPAGVLTGRIIYELFHTDDTTRLTSTYHELAVGQRQRFQTRVKLLTAMGDTIWVGLAVTSLSDAAGNPTCHVTMIEDLTEVQLLEQHLRYQALHDLLTGLPNQEYFWTHLQDMLGQVEPDQTVTLCKIDLDRFSMVNDGHGHHIGNRMLQSVANQLQWLVSGERAMVARFGGDEFAILIQDSPNTPDMATLAANINAELSEPVFVGDCGLSVSAGIGMVRRQARDIEAAELVRMADAAMHRAKRAGRGQWGVFDQTANTDERSRYTLANEMPGAWENGQVTLAYQPLVRVDAPVGDPGRIVAVQTLLCWDHPERGVITHEDCVALAEQSRLVLSIGRWMLQQACRQLGSWRDHLGAGVPPMRVDLTTHLGMDPDLIVVLRSTLDETGLAPHDVELGMPVELVMENRGYANDNLRTLMELGTRTVLTRFGQSIEDLATLADMPIYAVEITAKLTRMAQRPDSVLRQALASMILMIHSTGTAIVVAGIDSAEQADWWKGIGADSARGAAFTPPCAPDNISRLLAAALSHSGRANLGNDAIGAD